MRKTSNEFWLGELIVIIILVIFEDMASKLEKNWPGFCKFQYISILAIRNNKQQETVSVPQDSS